MTEHGKIRPRVIAGAFRLLRFTIPDLCGAIELDRKQVYPIVRELEEQKFLKLDTRNISEGKSHRPLNIYILADDPEKKRELLDQIPSLRGAEQSPVEESPSLDRL